MERGLHSLGGQTLYIRKVSIINLTFKTVSLHVCYLVMMGATWDSLLLRLARPASIFSSLLLLMKRVFNLTFKRLYISFPFRPTYLPGM